jgi:tyrosyl-tRNA synthetase
MDQIDFLLSRRVDKIYPSKEDLEKVLRSGKKLRLYQGFDPSSPTLHIGHLAGLKKLADFQKQGHEVIFLIGDFTGMIGDPSGKADSRKVLTREQVLENAKEYQKQAGKVLKFEGDNPVKIKFNSEWNSKLNFEDVLRLVSNVTAQNMWERDMFQERVKKGQEIWFHELMYPLIQGYDSVAMDVDLEIGGTDQMFNMMVGRELLHKMKNKNKFVLTTPLLVDKNGRKIGKTEGNAIAISDPPAKLFAGIMTLPDDVIIPAFKLITDEADEKINEYEKEMANGSNPMEFKKKLAHKIVQELNSENDAEKAQLEFENTVQGREVPENIFEIKANDQVLLSIIASQVGSNSEAKRLLEQKAIEVDGRTETNPQTKVIKNNIIKIGKRRFIKII